MGWSGYGLYDGDGTQTCHYEYIKAAKISKDLDEIASFLKFRKTVIPKEKTQLLIDNYEKIMKKMSKKKFFDEDSAIEWQMLLSLYLDNNLSVPANVKSRGISATKYLLSDHSDRFKEPFRRRRVLNNFLKKAMKAKVLK